MEELRGRRNRFAARRDAITKAGIRVPMIVCWPGIVPAGTTCDEPVINVDLYPTFLAAAKSDPPRGHVLDGESLLPLFQGESSFKREAIYWHFPGYLSGPVPRGRDPVFRTRPVSVIRKGDWKLHLYHEEWLLDGGRARLDTNRAVELYNLAEDPGERNDLALKDPQQRDELLSGLLAWISKVPAPLPAETNPKYRPAVKNPSN